MPPAHPRTSPLSQPCAIRDFDSTWTVAREFDGWLTDDQARLLWSCARELPAGSTVVEIGSHQAKSTSVLAAALEGRDCRLTAVDPHEEGFGPGHAVARANFERNLGRLGLRDFVHLIPEFSSELRARWQEPIDMFYIDGAHDYRNVVHDLAWLPHVRAGSVVLMHDAFSSVGVTAALLTKVLPGRSLRYVDRAQSLARFELSPPTARDRLRMLGQLPWFLRNVTIKILMVLRLHWAARVLGHGQGRDFPF